MGIIPDEIGSPLCISFPCEERRIAGHLNHIGVSYKRRAVNGLVYRDIDIALGYLVAALSVNGVFADKDLRAVSVIFIIFFIVAVNPPGRNIIMLVNNGVAVFFVYLLPGVFPLFAVRPGAGR